MIGAEVCTHRFCTTRENREMRLYLGRAEAREHDLALPLVVHAVRPQYTAPGVQERDRAPFSKLQVPVPRRLQNILQRFGVRDE